MSTPNVKEIVREKYGQTALRVTSGAACIINLSGDKDLVLKEAFRVLRPGGRFAVSDVVVRSNVPAEIKKNMALWVGCVAGALSDCDTCRNLPKPVLTISISSPRGFIASKTRGPSYRIGASTSMRWPERWETSLLAPLFKQTNPQRPAARLVAAPEIVFFL